jgi:hypothetical protein
MVKPLSTFPIRIVEFPAHAGAQDLIVPAHARMRDLIVERGGGLGTPWTGVDALIGSFS